MFLSTTKGRSPVRESSNLMREAGAPSTSGKWKSCTRPTGDGHDRTTNAPAQRFNGAILRATLEVGYEERGYARSGVRKAWPKALKGPGHPAGQPDPGRLGSCTAYPGGAIGYLRSGGTARARTRRPRHQGRARTRQRGQGTPSRRSTSKLLARALERRS